MDDELQAFRHELTRALNEEGPSVDISEFRTRLPASDDVASKAIRSVYLSRCMRTVENRQISNDERPILRSLGDVLQIAPVDQEKFLTAAKIGGV